MCVGEWESFGLGISRLAGHFWDISLFCRAPGVDVLAWGESLDHLLECKSESFWNPPPPCSSSTLTVPHCSAYFALNSPLAPPLAARTYSSFKFIESLSRREPRWATVAATRLPIGAAAVRLDDFSLLLFIFDGGAGGRLFIWPWRRPPFGDDLKGDGRVVPLCLCSPRSAEMNAAYL